MTFSFRKPLVALSVIASLTITIEANASLIQRTDNLVYDQALNVTWLADMKYAKTIGDSVGGKMSWADGNTWADDLNAFGSSTWRLPTLTEGLSLKSSYANHKNWFQHTSQWSGIWTATENKNNDTKATRFQLQGSTSAALKTNQLYIWSVTDGDIVNSSVHPSASLVSSSIPEPASLALFSFALFGLAYRRKLAK